MESERIRIKGSSNIVKTIMKDVSFETFESNIPFRTSENPPIDHRANSLMTDIKSKQRPKVLQSKILTKKLQQKHILCSHRVISTNIIPEGMFSF